jgi:hypothetical protein
MRSFLVVLGIVALPLASACSAFTGVDSGALVVDDDGGTDGDGGKSTRDGGTSRDGGSKTDGGGTVEPALGPECTALQSCCDFLDTTTAATCRSTALDANESSCSANLNAYQADGVCGGVSPTPVVDSGTGIGPTPTPDAGLLAGGYCSDLLSCCGSDTSCLSIALAGDESQCELEYLTEVESGGTSCLGVP